METKKGCGGFYHDIKGKICPKCKPKNHSPEEIHESDIKTETTSGTYSQQVAKIKLGDSSFKSQPVGTYNLSEKIRNWSGRKIVPYKDIKEFIQRLKDKKIRKFDINGDLRGYCIDYLEIDKHAGEDLVK